MKNALYIYFFFQIEIQSINLLWNSEKCGSKSFYARMRNIIFIIFILIFLLDNTYKTCWQIPRLTYLKLLCMLEGKNCDDMCVRQKSCFSNFHFHDTGNIFFTKEQVCVGRQQRGFSNIQTFFERLLLLLIWFFFPLLPFIVIF